MRKSLVYALGFVSCALLSLIFAPQFSFVARSEQQAFTGHENQSISLADASALTARFRASVPTGSVLGGYFAKDGLQTVLGQAGAVGVRYYYGLKQDGTPILVLTGVDGSGNDLSTGTLLENPFLCPPFCGSPNGLNR